ncbi:thiol S-methyltransferase TMT1B-like [Haemaphysalis longicornis]
MIFTDRPKLMLVATPILGWVWMLSFWYFGFVFLLPLLSSHKLREKYFVFFYQLVDVIWADSFAKTRRAALGVLDELESDDPELRKQGALRVLEVGAGTGANLKYIKRPLTYTNVDPNREFEPAFQEELKKNPHIELERWVQCYGEDMSELQEEHFDVVLLMYIFCTVNDPLKLIREAKRVLVKGGRLIYLEVVAYPQGTWQRLLQELVTPIWKFLACNFHVNRECHEDFIKSAGFLNVTANYVYLDMPVGINRHAYGAAVA